jgi:hypothetical protein
MRPVGNRLAALVLDSLMRGANSLERARRRRAVGEDDLLGIAGGDEQPPDGIARQFSREEEPIDRTVEREFGGGASEDEEHHVPITPDPPNN